jgi:predicted RNase H-like nuclease (RuvC/YqgF family)
MEQYRHQDFEFRPKDDADRIVHLEETVARLSQQVQQLSQIIEFLQRQDQRSRSSFEQISARIAARK